MTNPDAAGIAFNIRQLASEFSAHPIAGIADCLIFADLGIDRGDFVEFCEKIESRYRLSLRPLFEHGQPEQRNWLGHSYRSARDLTVAELVEYVVHAIKGHS